MIERNFPVVDASLDIGQLAQILNEILKTQLKANGPMATSPGNGIKTPVYILSSMNGDGLVVSVRNYAADPTLKKKQVGIAVRGDASHYAFFEQNLGPLLEYFI